MGSLIMADDLHVLVEFLREASSGEIILAKLLESLGVERIFEMFKSEGTISLSVSNLPEQKINQGDKLVKDIPYSRYDVNVMTLENKSRNQQ